MKELSEAEKLFREQVKSKYVAWLGMENGAFDDGFNAGLEYAQSKIDELERELKYWKRLNGAIELNPKY